jgi:hypothetical protein
MATGLNKPGVWGKVGSFVFIHTYYPYSNSSENRHAVPWLVDSFLNEGG